MAIDTAEKRKTASGIQVTLIPGVTPNSSKDSEWRQESGWGYPVSGIFGGMFVAGQVYNPGFREGESFSPGFKKGEVYVPGFKEGQVL